MQGSSGMIVEGSVETSAHRSCHMGMWRTPTKKRLGSDIIQVARKRGCKVAIMSDYVEKGVEEVLAQTPPGKEKEVLATVVVDGKDGVLSEVLQELKELKVKLQKHENAMIQFNAELKTSRAIFLRFFIEYVLSLYKVAGGKKVFGEIAECQLVVKHAVEGFKEVVPLNKDISSKLKKLQKLFSKASRAWCHAGTIREAAIAIVEIAKEFANDPKAFEDIVDKDGLTICQLMFVEVFGATAEEASTSMETKYNRMIRIEELRAE